MEITPALSIGLALVKAFIRSASFGILAGVLTDIGGEPTFHSCGTVTDSHRSFPVSSSG
ncbi:hypothetical protein SynNOUM97013_02472 [Synechococcus sp. NOUM97013]|nr:hypothetical protein SynNOUM97013_02472 [Synechococcus sp. NOUM97013]